MNINSLEKFTQDKWNNYLEGYSFVVCWGYFFISHRIQTIHDVKWENFL